MKNGKFVKEQNKCLIYIPKPKYKKRNLKTTRPIILIKTGKYLIKF